MLRIFAPSAVAVAIVSLAAACGGRIAPLDLEPDAQPLPDFPDADNEPPVQWDASLPRDAGAFREAAAPDTGLLRDANTPDADGGSTSRGPYPAFKPDVPRAVSRLGPIMIMPHIIPITFGDDPLAAGIEDFVSRIGDSSYWAAIVAGYGVGAARMEAPIHLKETPPADLTDPEIQAWLAAKLDGTHPDFPAATSDRIYAIFYPDGVTVNLEGALSCQMFGGYHSESKTASGTRFAYAVMPRCPSISSFHGLDALTLVTSHELLEAATDPFWQTAPAYQNVDDAHFAWEYVFGGELGDLCNHRPALTTSVFGYVVQRQWSNASIAGWHDPCVPVAGASASGAYFNAAPVEPDRLVFEGGLTVNATHIPVGFTRAIELDLFSDAPTPGPWTISAYDLFEHAGLARTLEISLDRTQGQNGDRVYATVKVVGKTSDGFSTLMIVSTLGDRTAYWPTIISY